MTDKTYRKVPLYTSDLNRLRAYAASQGVSMSHLVNDWMAEIAEADLSDVQPPATDPWTSLRVWTDPDMWDEARAKLDEAGLKMSDEVMARYRRDASRG